MALASGRLTCGPATPTPSPSIPAAPLPSLLRWPNQDIRGINDIAVKAKASGMIIVGGGLVKHQICNANLMRNGANWSVYINTVSQAARCGNWSVFINTVSQA